MIHSGKLKRYHNILRSFIARAYKQHLWWYCENEISKAVPCIQCLSSSSWKNVCTCGFSVGKFIPDKLRNIHFFSRAAPCHRSTRIMITLGCLSSFQLVLGFLHVIMCLILFGAVWRTELYLTSSVWFGQNGKTPLRSVTTFKMWQHHMGAGDGD